MKSLGFQLLATSAALVVLTSCGDDAESNADDASSASGNQWKGDGIVFAQEFEIRETDGKHLLYSKSETEPFTGNIERRQSNGELWEEHYLTGLKHGLQKKRSANGALVEASFEDGLLHGDVVMYDRHGEESSRMHYVHGILARLLPDAKGNSTKQ